MKRPLEIWRYFLRPGLCFSLSFLLVIPAVSAQTLPTSISVVVVQGEGVMNELDRRVPHDPAVRVEDENQKPVTGAAVSFTLPISGASGEFGNGSKTLTVVTDATGTAAANGFKTNRISGKLPIYVTVSFRGLRATTVINEMNAGNSTGPSSHGGGSKLWIILAVVGAAAAGGAVAATHKSDSSSTPPPTTPAAITITPGTGTIGAPR